MSPKTEAIRKLSESADDWGWKGGKPGEITGTRLMSELGEARRLADRGQMFGQSYPSQQYIRNYQTLYNQLLSKENSAIAKRAQQISDEFGTQAAAVDFASNFAALESAGIPRKYTGKLMEALVASKFSNQRIRQFAPELSKVLRPLSDDQRMTFIRLLQTDNTSASFEDLASRAKRVMGTQTSRRPRPS